MTRVFLFLFAFGALFGATGCEAYARLYELAQTAEDHESGTVHCDRRHVAPGATPEPFCQVLRETRGAPEFKRDCEEDFSATSGDGECPAKGRVGGCEIAGDHEDGSVAIDWFYEGDRADVRALCADRKRYEDGAKFVAP